MPFEGSLTVVSACRFAAASPNGRFAAGAALIDGKPFAAIEAVGKNLFAFFGSGTAEVCVHIHFGSASRPRRRLSLFQEESEQTPPSNNKNGARARARSGGELGRVRDRFGRVGACDDRDDAAATGGCGRLRTRGALVGHDGERGDARVALRRAALQAGRGPVARGRRRGEALAQVLCLQEEHRRFNHGPVAERSLSRFYSSFSLSLSLSLVEGTLFRSYFCGPGNIYRAEILFKAGVHPDTPGRLLTRQEFDTVWRHTVALLQRGYQTGSILTVDAGEFARGSRHAALRRYVYNNANCPRCATPVLTWQIAARTCYACPTCQPRKQPAATAVETTTPEKEKKKKRTKRLNQDQGVQQEEEAAAKKKIKPSSTRAAAPAVPFLSHCARESFAERLRQGGTKLTVAELRAQLRERKAPTSGLKADLVQRLDALLSPRDDDVDQKLASPAAPPEMRSALEAAADKARAGENRAVEHIAELHPSQTAAARRRLVIEHEPEVFEPPAC